MEPADANCRSPLLKPGQFAELLHASRLLNSTLDPEKVLHSLMELVNRLLRTEASSLILIDTQGKRLVFRAAAGQKAREIRRFTIPAGLGIAGWVIEHRKHCIANDVASDPRWSAEIAEKLAFPTRSLICVPLVSRGRLIGAIEAINRGGGEAFGEADIALLSTLATHAALAIENARLHAELARDNETILEQLRGGQRIIGTSPKMKALMEVIRKVTPTDSTLLIRGESGTGKELIAKTIHYNSPRRAKPFTCVNCTLYSETLIESELFGHEQGAFTGAAKRRIGRFEQADGGSVFLDEVGSIPHEGQLKLLRVLEEREFERLGGSETIRVDVRIIAATNEDLEAAIAQGRFREDLYYRLKVIELQAPPLREHPEDIQLLAGHFLEERARQMGRPLIKVSPAAAKILAAYGWPGNVRELRNSIERAIVLGSGDTLLPEHLPPEIRAPREERRGGLTLENAERDRIAEVLAQAHWNKSRAARMLGISRNRLDRKIDAYRIARKA